jgi:uncharacterized protein YbgA (DUF1722 family)/uncharacterized protein YbbK (DUF523 family)
MADQQAQRPEPLPRLGISSCLLGEEVRFDGGHKRDDFLINTLGRFVEWVLVCPEVEIGLGTPRESLRLEAAPDGPRLIAPRSRLDHTEAMTDWARGRLEELAGLDLHGYVFKKDSPSCGLERVRVYEGNKMPTRIGQGIFAHELVTTLSLLPAEEEGRLREPWIRENFIDRVFGYYRWSHLLGKDPTPSGLVSFQASHKLTLMSHSPQGQRDLGRLVANAGRRRIQTVLDEYGREFMKALSQRATPRKHTNVLHHLMGFLKRQLERDDKEELLQTIDGYREGLVPLIVPLTLLQHHLRRHEVPEWVRSQVYLNPYPSELMLRNQV